MHELSRDRQGLTAGAILLKQIESIQPMITQTRLLLSALERWSAGEHQTTQKNGRNKSAYQLHQLRARVAAVMRCTR